MDLTVNKSIVSNQLENSSNVGYFGGAYSMGKS